LALSGGGIRSATFSLGVLQALGELHVLRKLDYMSTVSGGGYIGAWFSKWLYQLGARNDIDSIEKVDRLDAVDPIDKIECALTPGSPDTPVEREPEQIKFLRQYSNYLTPKVGAFSADTWALLATYVRNTTLNLAILVALLAAVMVVPRLLAALVDQASINASPARWNAYASWGFSTQLSPFTAVAVVAALWSVFWIAASISSMPDPTRKRHLWGQRQGSILVFIVVPLMLAAFFGSSALWEHRDQISASWKTLLAGPAIDNPILIWLFVPGIAYFIAWAGGWALAQVHNRALDRRNDKPSGDGRPTDLPPAWRDLWAEAIGHSVCAIVALAVGTLLVIVTTSTLHGWATQPGRPTLDSTIPLVAFGMPALLSVFGITMILAVGLVGRLYTDKSREWWARQGGWTSICVIAWLALAAVSLYAPPALGYLHARVGTWISAMLGSAWFLTSLGGMLAGKSSATGGADRKTSLEWLARVAPPLFSIGAVCLVSALVHYLLLLPHQEALFPQRVADANAQILDTPALTMLQLAIGFVVGGLLLAWRVDINKFSIHMMYRNRLVRAYLGASNPKREAHPFTGFDPADDIHLDEFLPKDGKLQRPCHIVNTALNLVNGDELAWQTRKAANFTFTPAFCGFELPATAAPGGAKLAHQAMRGGFRRTCAYRPAKAPRDDEERGVNLGMAMAVSGAAASPSMGFRSSPSLAFLMTLFNVRLGRWFVNPTRPIPRPKPTALQPRPSPRTSPKIGILHLIRELFGLTDANSDYVYLSDGGHFENLGVYELVRRRCRLIVAIDASADSEFGFGDLGNMIRKCGTDLHVEIEIKVGQIELQKQSEFSQAHCVTGKIRYDKVDKGARPGTLLYIKPSLLGTEFAELLNYRKSNQGFPHQSTADQWFDETQFEAYRSLGYQIGKNALEDAIQVAVVHAGEDYDIATLCEALHAIWDRTEAEAAAARKPVRPLKLVQYRGLTDRRSEEIPHEERRHEQRRQA
ncbi:MAG: patatin-like phospholipase family protein, partial [Pseudomonadota bacterium]|nr:patatin-like phospholipase family protein [Pseudomonadota bacterium]